MRRGRIAAAGIVAALLLIVAAGPRVTMAAEGREMTPQALLDLTDRFLNDGFNLKQAQAMLGPVVDASNPNNFVAQPRDPGVERLVYGLVDLDGARTLMSISIKYRPPIQMDLSLLVRTLGEPRRGARLKPHQPRPHIFDVKGEDHAGILTLGLAPGEGMVREVVTVQLTRLLPEG